MTRLWRPGGETVLDAVHAVQQKPEQGQQQNSNDDHGIGPSRPTAPPRIPTTSTSSQRDTCRPGNRGSRSPRSETVRNVPRPDDTGRRRQGRTLRPPQVSWPFPVRLRTTTRPPRAHAHAIGTSPRPSADGSAGQAASIPARSPPQSPHRPPPAARRCCSGKPPPKSPTRPRPDSRRRPSASPGQIDHRMALERIPELLVLVLKPLHPLRHVGDGTGAHRYVVCRPDGRHAIRTPGGMTLGKSHEKRLPHSPTSTQRCHPKAGNRMAFSPKAE